LRSSAFPTTAQGQEQIDLAHGNLSVGRGQLRAHIGVRAGGLQVGEKRFAAGLEERGSSCEMNRYVRKMTLI